MGINIGKNIWGIDIVNNILVYFCIFWSPEVPDGPQEVPDGPQRWYAALVCSVGMPASQTRVGDGGGDDGDGDGRIFPEHPSAVLHAPRDIISSKGKSLTPITIRV